MAQLRAAWNREEAVALLEIAREHEPGFAPFLELLFARIASFDEGLRWQCGLPGRFQAAITSRVAGALAADGLNDDTNTDLKSRCESEVT